jgi:hypothetical protein
VSAFLLLLAWFLAPFAITAGMLYVRRTTRPEDRLPQATRARLVLEILSGVGLVVAYVFTIAVTAADVGAYETDPSCRQSANFSEPVASGACTVLDAEVWATLAEFGSPHHTSRYFPIYAYTADSRLVTSASPFDGGLAVWRAAYARHRIPARIQLFRNRIVRIEVAGASGPTSDLPSQSRFNKIESIASGIGLILAAFLEFALAPIVLKPGE